jgi:hypothetical protein
MSVQVGKSNSENLKIKCSIVNLKRPISGDAGQPSMILVLLKHTPNPSSQFIDLDIGISFSRGTLANNESSLYNEECG